MKGLQGSLRPSEFFQSVYYVLCDVLYVFGVFHCRFLDTKYEGCHSSSRVRECPYQQGVISFRIGCLRKCHVTLDSLVLGFCCHVYSSFIFW